MNDKALAVLEKYDIEVLRSWKGRSAILCETKTGIKILKEYKGSEKRLLVQQKLLEKIEENGFIGKEKILCSKEGELIVKDEEMNSYYLKEYKDGKECNLKDSQEIGNAVSQMAKLHKSMVFCELSEEEGLPVFSLVEEFEKHTKELRKVKKYLKTKRQKDDFEYYLYQNFNLFLEKAEKVLEEVKQRSSLFSLDKERKKGMFCHGDMQHHNVLMNHGEVYFINFEKFIIDDSMRDLSLFLRKTMEKNNWSQELGSYILQTYQKENAITEEQKLQIYYRLFYPEKFWKITNFYFNSSKSWIPVKNKEKLEMLIKMEVEKNRFLESTFDRFRTIHC
ncbi:MAG: CotS family spore coat protein [Lachnospiraceae bacterium]|nr:CotS family spore coat protein [Lachnospiraceae bacterium]